MVDISIRAHEWISNWIAQNYNNFITSSNYGKVWGKIDRQSDVTEVLVNKDVLSAAMKEAGFDLNSSLLQKMAERNQIRRNSQNRFVHQTTIHGIKATYICFLFENDDFEEMSPEENPFD